MTRQRATYWCVECGSLSPRWTGRCPSCGRWNTIESAPAGTGTPAAGRASLLPLSAVSTDGGAVTPTGIAELDRVLGGGLVASSVTLVAGEPGIGKSTLLLQALASMARAGRRALLVSAEESPSQVRQRASRLGLLDAGILVTADTDMAAIRAAIVESRADVVVVDSIQTIGDTSAGFSPGTLASVRSCAQSLAEGARAGGPAVLLVGHVTKEGAIAGPRALEHLVDTVLHFEGDRHHALRMMRAVKHRYGPVGELGLWEMTADGLKGLAGGGSFVLSDRRPGTPGSALFAAMEGRRPLLLEVQALVAPSPAGSSPRRSATRYESGRLAQLLAVLDRRAGLGLRDHDVYVSVVGGVRLTDPGADLAVAVAVASAATGRPATDDSVVIGEVGLGGELRQVAHCSRRLLEAARHGLRSAVVPSGTVDVEGIFTRPAPDLAEALSVALAPRPERRPRLVLADERGSPLAS